MGTFNHTPDPAQGALIEAAGVIVLPDDNESMKADNIQLGDEQLADWVVFLVKGPANDIDYKITGNGEPPAGGYTPTTNPIRINGTGLEMASPLVHSGADGYRVLRTVTIAGSLTLSGTEFDVVLADLSGGNRIYTLQDTGPQPPDGAQITIWTQNVGNGNTLEILRETGGSQIATYAADTHASGTYTYRGSWGGWRLTGGFNVTLGANP